MTFYLTILTVFSQMQDFVSHFRLLFLTFGVYISQFWEKKKNVRIAKYEQNCEKKLVLHIIFYSVAEKKFQSKPTYQCLVNKHFLVTLKKTNKKKHGSQWDPEPILDFWGPYAKLCLRNPTQNVSLLWLAMLLTRFVVTLNDLNSFYVERATAPHYNKLSFMFSLLLVKFKN